MSAPARLVLRLRRLARRVLFRPVPAVLLFGSLMAASNWLWYGSGLFLSPAVGLSLMGGVGLAGIGVLVALARRRRQLRALTLLIVAAVGLPAIALIALRLKTGAPLLMHDGAYQTEEAIRFLLSGQDPYGQDYTRTSMRLWHWYVNQPLDPALFHYVYYPLTFLIGVPFAALATVAQVAFDDRLVLLLAGVVAAAGLLALPWRWEWRFLALVVLFLDPFFYLAQGRNDILFLAALVLGALAWSRERPVAAGWSFGVALAFKQFSLLFLAPLAVGLLARRRQGRIGTGALVLGLAGLIVPAALSIGPFLAWDPAAFWTDTVGVLTGTVPHSFSIRGFGLSALMVATHLLPGPDSAFPFGLVQIGVAAASLAVGLPRVWARPSTGRILSVGAWSTVGVLACSRYLNDSHLAVMLFLLILAGLARRGETAARLPRDQAAPVWTPGWWVNLNKLTHYRRPGGVSI